MSKVIFGQYYPSGSIVHKLDPRAKILFVIAYLVTVFLTRTFYGFAVLGLFLLATVFISRLPLTSVIRSVKAILFIVIFTFVLNLFFYSTENATVYWSWWRLTLSDKSIQFSSFMALRLILLVMGTSILTLTTNPVELTDGIESLLKPLKLIKFPVHELALIMSIALRFIPTLMEETERIIKAQKARGADFDDKNIIKKAKALLPVLVPLLVSSFRRADELGDAMDARCYSASTVRTKYKKLKFGCKDLVATLYCLLFFVATVALNFITVSAV